MKVVYKYPNNGYTGDQELAEEHLTLGETYELSTVDQGDWHTDYFLKGFGDLGFNSVLFKVVK